MRVKRSTLKRLYEQSKRHSIGTSRIKIRKCKVKGVRIVEINNNRAFVIDESKIHDFWRAVRQNKGAKDELIAKAKKNSKNRKIEY